MRRTTGIVASLIVIGAFLVGIAIGRMGGDTSRPPPGSDVVSSAVTILPLATMEDAPPSPGILSMLVPGNTLELSATSTLTGTTPQSSPETGILDGPATPGTSPVDYLKP
ncbi:MAG: hypothetical protein ACR2OU_16365 [Thermomicrobiales bacterium]